MNQTENYGFLLPTDDDFYDIEEQQNKNWLSIDSVLKKITESISNLVVIGDTEPSSGPVLWFNTAPTSSGVEAALLTLSDEEDADVKVNVDGTDYSVSNVVASDDENYSYEIL